MFVIAVAFRVQTVVLYFDKAMAVIAVRTQGGRVELSDTVQVVEDGQVVGRVVTNVRPGVPVVAQPVRVDNRPS